MPTPSMKSQAPDAQEESAETKLERALWLLQQEQGRSTRLAKLLRSVQANGYNAPFNDVLTQQIIDEIGQLPERH